MTSILVKDHMQHNAYAVNDHANVEQVVAHLLNHTITGAPVTAEEHLVVGLVSEQACIKEMLISTLYGEESSAEHSLIHQQVLIGTPDPEMLDDAETILKKKPKRYPVAG